MSAAYFKGAHVEWLDVNTDGRRDFLRAHHIHASGVHVRQIEFQALACKSGTGARILDNAGDG